MSGHEDNNGSLAPQTAAAQFLQARNQGNAVIMGVDTPASIDELLIVQTASQTHLDVGEAALSVSSSRLYDYESDGVFTAPVSPTKSLLSFAGRGALIPAIEIGRQEHGNGVKLSVTADWAQKPSITTRNALEQATEIAKESGTALIDAVNEVLEVKEAKPDKEAVAAVAFVCMQLVTHYSEREATDSRVTLTGVISQAHPDILKDPQFRSVMKRFGKDPEGFKQGFAALENKAAIVEELPLVPAFHEFVEAHAIDPKELFGDLL